MFPLFDQNEPGRGLAYVTLALIGINLVVFFLIQANDPSFTAGYSAVPAEITTGTDIVRDQILAFEGQCVRIDHAPGPVPVHLTLVSSMFMHGGVAHILGNMLFLFIFGDNVEHAVGRFLFVPFYIATGLVGALAQIALDPDSFIPLLGASGAISGVLGAYLVMFPGNTVTVFLFRLLVPVPAIVAIGMWALFQFVNGFGAITTSQETTGGVAYMAHIGGFAAGVVAGLLFRGAGGGRRRSARLAF